MILTETSTARSDCSEVAYESLQAPVSVGHIGYSTGTMLRGMAEQGGDQFVGGVLHTVKDYVEKPLFTVAGAVLGNPELGENAPVKQFSEWFDRRAEERREKYAENAAKGGTAYPWPGQRPYPWGGLSAEVRAAAGSGGFHGRTGPDGGRYRWDGDRFHQPQETSEAPWAV